MPSILSNLGILDLLSVYQTASDYKQNKDISNKKMLEYIFQIALILDRKMEMILNENDTKDS